MRIFPLIQLAGCVLLVSSASAAEVAAKHAAGKIVAKAPVVVVTQLSVQQAHKQLLDAERMRGYPAIFRLRELLQQSDDVLATIPQGREGMRVRLAQALLDALPEELNPERHTAWVDEVQQQMGLVSNVSVRAWIGINLLRQMSPADVSQANKVMKATLDALRQEQDGVKRSYIAGALAETLLTVPNLQVLPAQDVDSVAYDLLKNVMITSKQRAVVSQLMAIRALKASPDTVSLFAAGMDKESRADTLLDKAKTALGEKQFAVATQYALAAEPKKYDARDDLLNEIAQQALKVSALKEALAALSGIKDENDQNKRMKDAAKALLEMSEVPWAATVAAQIDDGSIAADMWVRIAKVYKKSDYDLRVKQAQGHAWDAALRITKPAQRAKTFAMLAEEFAAQKSLEHVPQALEWAVSAKDYPKALSEYVQRLTEAGNIAEAQKQMLIWPVKNASNQTMYDWDEVAQAYAQAHASIAKALAKKGDVKGALDVLRGDVAAITSTEKDQAWRAVVHAQLKVGMIEEANTSLDVIQNDAQKAIALTDFVVALYEKKTPWIELESRFQEAVKFAEKAMTGRDASDSQRDDPLVVMSTRLLGAGLIDPAKQLLEKTSAQASKAGVLTAIARYYAFKGDVGAARVAAERVSNELLRDQAYASVSDALVRANHIRDAVAVIQLMKGDIARVQAFHSAARIQAYRTDFYGLLVGMEGNTQPPQQLASPGNTMPSPSLISDLHPSPQELTAFEQKLIDDSRTKSDAVLLKDPVPSAIGKIVPAFNKEALQVNETRLTLAKKLPEARDYRVSMVSYEAPDAQQKFTASLGLAGFARFQQSFSPEVILVEKGVVDISALYLDLRTQGLGDEVIKKEGRTYLLRRPIVVAKDAALVISGAGVDDLRLSTERGAYIVNMGTLYIQDTHVTGWSETKSAPNFTGVDDKYRFRPFVTSWSLSHSYFGGSVFTALGYAGTKAYGVSLSSGPKDLLMFKPSDIARPDGIIAENSFRNLYYGFYSFEADRVALIGNEYKDNIIYGIDPHDRSRYLTIAFNTAWGAYKKHGIIISREVNDTTIIGNVTFKNHGSGFMMDRLSIGSMVYANTGFDNGQDGLTVYESDCKLIASNRFFANHRDGVKIRNSRDIGVFYNVLHDNRRAGVEGYTADLKADPTQAHRDFELDPYSTVVAFTMVGNWIERNGVGISGADIAAAFLKGNFFIQQSPKLFRGDWFKAIPELMSRFDLMNTGVVATPRCPSGIALPEHEVCKFRSLGILNGDGQDRLYQRINQKLCEVRT